MSWLSGFETHHGTITGERQTGTEEDDFGGTQPVYETVPLYDGYLRYEPNGAGLARDFQGESSEDEPVVFIEPAYMHDDYAVQEDDTLEIDGIEGTFETRNIEEHHLDAGGPDFVICNPVNVE